MTDTPDTQPQDAYTWAESVASTGTGNAAVIEIDINAPSETEPVPVEVPLADARILHVMLGGAIAEHDGAEPQIDGPGAGRMLGHIAKKLNVERSLHEEHRRGMALLLDLPADADWLTVTRRTTEVATRLADYENRLSWETNCGEHARLLDVCRETEEERDDAEAALARVRAECAAIGTDTCNATTRILAAIDGDQPAEAQPGHTGIRGLLEHVGIDTTGRDITVAGKVVDAAEAQPEPKSPGIFPGVQGRCPACNGHSLILGSGGYVTCGYLECPDPEAATNLLENPAAVVREQPAMPPVGDWARNAADQLLNAASAIRDAANALTDPQ